MKGSPVRVRASASLFMRVPALCLIADRPCVKFRVKLTFDVVAREQQVPPRSERLCGTRCEDAVSGFLRRGLNRSFPGGSASDGERGPWGGQPSHTQGPGSGHRHSRDKEYSLHFGFGHSNRLWSMDSGCASRPIRGAPRATEGWLDVFSLDRRLSRIRIDMPNPGRSASAGRRDLRASP
jgi:hypothetical protein